MRYRQVSREWLAVRVHAGCSAFPFTLRQNRQYDFILKTKKFCFLNYKYIYILDIYNIM